MADEFAKRPDHFEHMRGSPAPPAAPDEAAPVVAPALVEHLEAIFKIAAPVRVSTLEDAIQLLTYDAASYGHWQVIDYLRTLVRGA